MTDLNIDRLIKLTDTCLNLLETLTITLTHILSYAEEHDVPIPNKEKFIYLLDQAIKLISELESPKSQQRFRTPLSDEWKQRKDSNGEVTEPYLV